LTTLGVAFAALCAAPPAHAATPPCTTDNLLAGKLPAQQRDVTGDPTLVTNGTVVLDGALWDGPAGIKLQGTAGSLTYDLGAPTRLSAFILQADANDTYKITGSPTGEAGSFTLIALAANVVDQQGHGMRTRSIKIEPVTVRYLRIGEADGDGAFSISEFAAYCAAPTPFPPAMQTVDAPMAVAPKPAGGEPTAIKPPPPKSALGPLEVILLLLLALVAYLARRATRGAPGGASNDERMFPLVLLLFLGSGCAALMYEIIWFQMLQLVLGSSAISIAVLLGTFMAGMCIGSLALPRYVRPGRHPLRVYAVLELAIAASGLLMLVAMPLVQGIYTTIVGHGVPGLMLRGVFAAICLLPPTIMMGATLPAVARWVETTPRGVSWLGFFYGGNTIGAVFGCLIAGFYLLRVHNMPIATFVAVALGVTVASAAFLLARLEPRAILSSADANAPAPAAGGATAEPPAAPWVVYLAIGLSGATAMGAEVVWTRLFGLLLSGTTYTFSIILAVFLIGIGLGSGVGSAIARQTKHPRRALGIAQAALIAAIAWTSWNITTQMPFWPVNPRLAATPWSQFELDFARSIWAILPAAFLWGASFPLALASVAIRGQDGAVVVGRVYAANTVGAILGAIISSLVLIAAIGTHHTEQLMIWLAALSAVVVLVPGVADRFRERRLTLTDGTAALAVLALASVVSRNLEPVSPLLIGHGRFSAVERNGGEQYLFVGEGMNSSPAVSRDTNGILSYHNAGKVQASSLPQDMRLQRMLGHLTTLIPEQPKSVLVIACGAGVTAGASSIDPRVEHLTIAEIEPLVPKVVAKYFGDYNFNVVKNPKVTVEVDDARHFLNTTKEKFDAITSDPFDPWVKGAANLYTKEFWQLARDHLTPDGIVTVFVQLYDSGMAAVKSEIATFMEVFPDGLVFGNTVGGEGYDIVLVGKPGGAPHIDVDAMERRLNSPEYVEVLRSLRQTGFDSATMLLSTYGSRGPELKTWLQDAEINRDNNLRLQFLAGFGMNVDQRVEIYRGILHYRRYPEDLFTGSPARLAALRAAIAARPQY
jgi:spermidine synthase